MDRLVARPSRRYLAVLRTGLPELDGLFPSGGIPLGVVMALVGEGASGRVSLALRVSAAATQARRLVAYVDGPCELYPPAAEALGVDLRRLLIVRPRRREQLVWSAVQLTRSGAFACVVLDLSHDRRPLPASATQRLRDAASQGGGALLLLASDERAGEGMLRLGVRACDGQRLRLEVLHSRAGGAGRRASLTWTSLFRPFDLSTFRHPPPRGD